MPVVRGVKHPEIVQAREYPPSDESLRADALAFIKGNKRKLYRQLKQDPKELQEYLDLKVSACKRAAQNLIECGTWENEAWRLAIRQEILEVESD